VADHEPILARMRASTGALLSGVDDEVQRRIRCAFDDDTLRRRLEYRPRPRPGASLADLDPRARKAAHELLATALSPHAYAQAMTVLALEEVLDSREEGRNGRHSNDFWIAIFGDPDRDDHWGWRFEGHHLSVSVTVAGDEISATPLFLGANPAAITYAGRPIVRPLAPEEDLARTLLDAMGPARRAEGVVDGTAADDIRSSVKPQADLAIAPLGVSSETLNPAARGLLAQLLAVYLDRLPPVLAAREYARLDGSAVYFAWEGPQHPGVGHYYRIQGPDLLIEYDNTQDGANHAHSVLRRPLSDFGEDILAEHRAEAHGTA
jgi:hypothetical protein